MECEILEPGFQTTYFKDGKRKIDYVLTYECNGVSGEEECNTVDDVEDVSRHLVCVLFSYAKQF